MKDISRSRRSFCIALFFFAAWILTGCSEFPESSRSATADSPAAVHLSAPSMTGPLGKEQVGANYSLVGEPVLTQDDAVVRTIIAVNNRGTVRITSGGTMPVHLAISLIDGEGGMVAQDFIRAGLPAAGIEPGATVDVVTEVPADQAVGNGLRFGLVQESVAWYSAMDVAPLDYGPLTRCENDGRSTVCGSDGRPLAQAQ